MMAGAARKVSPLTFTVAKFISSVSLLSMLLADGACAHIWMMQCKLYSHYWPDLISYQWVDTPNPIQGNVLAIGDLMWSQYYDHKFSDLQTYTWQQNDICRPFYQLGDQGFYKKLDLKCEKDLRSASEGSCIGYLNFNSWTESCMKMNPLLNVALSNKVALSGKPGNMECRPLVFCDVNLCQTNSGRMAVASLDNNNTASLDNSNATSV